MSRHPDIHSLLPFYLNRTLTRDEQAEVEAALQSDAALREELRMWQAVQDELRTLPLVESPGELGLRRLQKAIAMEKAKKPHANDNIRLWRGVAITAALLALVQAALFFGFSSPLKENYYYTASGDHPAGEEKIRLAVTFVHDAPEASIRALLLRHHLSIVEGPSQLGLYQLEIRGESNADDILTTLESSPIVATAQWNLP